MTGKHRAPELCPDCSRPRGGTCRCDWNREPDGQADAIIAGKLAASHPPDEATLEHVYALMPSGPGSVPFTPPSHAPQAGHKVAAQEPPDATAWSVSGGGPTSGRAGDGV